MPKSFHDSIAAELMKLANDVSREAKIGESEIDVLKLFYDDKKKARKSKLPRFFIYARICEGKLEDSWPTLMIKADKAILTLEQIGFVERATPSLIGGETERYVGKSSEAFKLTPDGLERLQRIRPDLALKLKGWIAVAPPWLVLLGTICGGLSALWGFTRLLMSFGLFA